MSDYVLGQGPNKWLIFKGGAAKGWHLCPPLVTFWGRHTTHYTFGEAVADFVRQTTTPPPGFPMIQGVQ